MVVGKADFLASGWKRRAAINDDLVGITGVLLANSVYRQAVAGWQFRKDAAPGVSTRLCQTVANVTESQNRITAEKIAAMLGEH